MSLPADQVKVSQDFERWGARIEWCPPVSFITAAEVDGYLVYLLSVPYSDADDDLARPRDWQNYGRCCPDQYQAYLAANNKKPEQDLTQECTLMPYLEKISCAAASWPANRRISISKNCGQWQYEYPFKLSGNSWTLSGLP